MNKTVTIKLDDTYYQAYKIRKVNTKGQSMETTVPIAIIQRQANKEKISVEEFLQKFKLEWRYNGFEGIFVRFVKDGETETQ